MSSGHVPLYRFKTFLQARHFLGQLPELIAEGVLGLRMLAAQPCEPCNLGHLHHEEPRVSEGQ